jgi:hypothetical protein
MVYDPEVIWPEPFAVMEPDPDMELPDADAPASTKL